MTRGEKLLAGIAGAVAAGVGGWFLWKRFGWAKIRVDAAQIYDDPGQSSSGGLDVSKVGSTSLPYTLPKGTTVRRTGSVTNGMQPIAVDVGVTTNGDHIQSAWWVSENFVGGYFGEV